MKVIRYLLAAGAIARANGRTRLGRTLSVGLLLFCACVALVAPAQADFFNYVTIGGDCLGGNGTITTLDSGPVRGSLSNTASCAAGNQSFTESELANFSTVGASVTATGTGTGSSVGGEVSALSVQLLTVSGLPMGQTVDLKFDMHVTGSYKLTPASGGTTGFFENTYIFLGGNGGGTGCSAPAPSSVCLGSGGTPGSGTISADFMSSTFTVQAGKQYEFEQEIALLAQTQGAGSKVTADFLDPASIVNVIATDPKTGLPISGVSVTTDGGITYPVNGAGPSGVPEPSTLFLVGPGAALLLFRTQRRRKSV